jgi:hypothetical protein
LTWPIYPICIPCNHFIFIFNSVVKYIKIIINMGGRVIVFKPGPVAGPVQGSCSRFWSGHPVARVNPYFLKNQNDVILVKKKTKVNGLHLSFWPGFVGSPGHTESWLFLFFLQPGLVPAPGQLDPESTCQAEPGFKTMGRVLWYYTYN